VTTCSIDAIAAHEPLPGTSPYATAWIVIEQPGPWGRDALAESHLDDDVARHLSPHAGTGVGVLLARHPDRPERAGLRDRHVWLARSSPGASTLQHAVLHSIKEIAKWDLTAIGAGELPALGSVSARPMMFVCTHSGRDLCCATGGRALITTLMQHLPPGERERVWECSHIGGHRFAPVSLSLPSGAVHGRLDATSAIAVLKAADHGRTVTEHLRGRSSHAQPLQVAAIAVQRRFHVDALDELDVLVVRDEITHPIGPAEVARLSELRTVDAEVRHADGRSWRANVVARPLERDRLESCGKQPVPGIAWSCTRLEAGPDWR
jgi:hypothetical protein